MNTKNTSTGTCSSLKLALVAGVFCLSAYAPAQAQNKRILEQAATYYAGGDYYTAARLYEQYLNPDTTKKPAAGMPIYTGLGNSKSKAPKGTPSRLEIVYKQAESYRLCYHFPEAAAGYKACMDAAADQYPESFYWYAVCQRSVGNYTAAQEALNKFLWGYGAKSPLKAAAEFEKQTLDFIQAQLNRPDTILYRIVKAETSDGMQKGVYAPVGVSGTQFIVTSTEKDSAVKKNQNPYHNRLYYAANNDRSLGNLEMVVIEGLDESANQGTASISPDGNTLYFTQWKKTNGKSVAAIYSSKKKDGKWSKPEEVPGLNAAGSNSKQPSLSADGQTLYFASDRAGGAGQYDIWYTTIDASGAAGAPKNAGTVLNTAGDEQAPYYHSASKTLIFSNNSRVGMGGYDLFATSGSEAAWQEPKNLGYPVNSTRDDIYYYAADGQLLKNGYFSSDRGSNCCLETYNVEKLPKKRVLSGQVVTCEGSEPLADAEVSLKNGPVVKTNDQGRYSIELPEGTEPGSIAIAKEKYESKQTEYTTAGTNETDPLTDTLLNQTVCLEKVLVVKPEEVIIIYFDFDKSKLTERSREQLDSVYAIVAENPKAKIQISGYTDGMGAEDYNIQLGNRRAKACADYLIQKGIEADRITFRSFGECCPVEDEKVNGKDNPGGRKKNRRALINITRE
jgi:outer membrane protein OmpA-like peptidoglycan-associated protein